MLKRFTSHTLMALAEASLIALLVVGLIAGTAFAARGGGGKGPKGGGSTGGTGTISLPIIVESADAVVSYGDKVRFDISTTSTTEPWVRLTCYQGGTLVAQGSEGYFERSLDDGVFGLYSGMWQGGAADCTAKLTKADGSVLGTTSFHVEA